MRLRFAERPMSHQRGWRFMATLALIALAAVAGLTFIGFNAPNAIPGRSYYTVQAAFENADNITGHYQVRMDGRLVGQVLDPRIDGGQAVVDLQLEPDVAPLRADTRVEVRPRSAVGVRYVDLRPGRSGRPLTEGDRIPASQTSSTVQLDDVLGTFDPDTRLRAEQAMRELGRGTAGRGEDLNEVQERARPVLEDAREVADAIVDRSGAVRGLLRGSGQLAGALDPVREPLAEGFAPQADALRELDREATQRTLERAPGALRTLADRLPEVTRMADELGGLAQAARPLLTSAPQSLRQTSALLRESRPGLRTIDDTLRAAGRAVEPTLGLLRAVRPVLPGVDATVESLQPIVATLGRHGCDFKDFGDHWGSMMAWGNAAGPTLRINVIPGPDSLYGQARTSTTLPVNPYPEPCRAKDDRVGTPLP